MRKLKFYFQKAKSMPIDKLIKKGTYKIYNKIYFLYRKVKTILWPVDIPSEEFKNFFSNLSFIFDNHKKEEYISTLRSFDKEIERTIINDADTICNHVFNLLGSGDKYLGINIKWNRDFKSEFEWKNKFYKDIKIVDLNNNSDVKVPWELSRFQHFFTLGKAYWLTNNEKYAREFKNQVESWIKENPFEMSINWTCAMDVAIRAVNWIIGYFFFKDSNTISIDFWANFNKNIYLHGRFIYDNLENKEGNTGNHYLSDIVGLVWIGLYFREFIPRDNSKAVNSNEWLNFALSELEKEIFVQVNEDGTNYEASTSYHRLVTELFLITTVLCKKNNLSFSKEYLSRLEKMCEFIMHIIKPNGLCPLIGDADDGRLLITSNYSSWERSDFRHILAIAGEFFDRDDFRYYGRIYKEDILWIIGFNNTSSSKKVKLESRAYSDGGYYVLRNERIYCLVRCGELSFRGQGGHSHNDQLSIELNIDGEDFLVDPGVFVYTADYKMRNLYRSTESHNTLAIENLQQNYFNEYELFYMKEETFAKCEEFNENYFRGKHVGFLAKANSIHERIIQVNEEELVITDLVSKENSYEVLDSGKHYINFILDSDVNVIPRDKGIELTKNNRKISMQFNEEYEITDASISKKYGQKIRTKKIVIKSKECIIKTKFKMN